MHIRRLPVVLFLVVMFTGAVAAQRAAVSAAEVTGTFEMNFQGKYRKMSNDLKVQALGKGMIKFEFDLIYPYTLKNGDISVNMGGLTGEIPIRGDTAVYASEDAGCTITIKFVRKGVVSVKQEGSSGTCGFGHNVTSEGTYRKTSSKRPKFEEPM